MGKGKVGTHWGLACVALLAAACIAGANAETGKPAAAGQGVDLLALPALQSPKAAHGLLLGVHAAGSRLVAVGERGIAVFSDDEGRTWTQGQVPVSVTLTAVFFVSGRLGWAVGHDGVILRTQDGGQSWRLVLDGNRANALVIADLKSRIETAEREAESDEELGDGETDEALDALRMRLEDVEAGAGFGPSRPLLSLWFRDESNGFAVGSFGQIFQTADGGESWTSLAGLLPNPDSLHFNAIALVPGLGLVIAGERGSLWLSRDEGASWSRLETGYDGHLYGVLPLSSDALLAYGFAGNLFRSGDRGQSWQAIPRATTKTIVGGMKLTDGTVLLIARNGDVISSMNGGVSFQHANSVQKRNVASVLPTPFGGGKQVVAGAGGVLVTDLGGGRR